MNRPRRLWILIVVAVASLLIVAVRLSELPRSTSTADHPAPVKPQQSDAPPASVVAEAAVGAEASAFESWLEQFSATTLAVADEPPQLAERGGPHCDAPFFAALKGRYRGGLSTLSEHRGYAAVCHWNIELNLVERSRGSLSACGLAMEVTAEATQLVPDDRYECGSLADVTVPLIHHLHPGVGADRLNEFDGVKLLVATADVPELAPHRESSQGRVDRVHFYENSLEIAADTSLSTTFSFNSTVFRYPD